MFLSCFTATLQWIALKTRMEEPIRLASDAPGQVLEENMAIAHEAATTSFKMTKVELSPKYQEILSGYLRLRNEPNFKVRQYYRFVAKLDPEISLRNFEGWVAKLKKSEVRERQIRIKNFAETALSRDASVEAIADAAVKVFYLKITEFLKDPDMLDHMTFRDALMLYEKIERLTIAKREMKLKEHDQTRKDVFTLFSIKALSGEANLTDIDKLQSQTYATQPGQPALGGT